jgi:methionyl-tRNA formyltransferase
MRVVFWGTPPFAAPSLRAILGEGHEVVAVVTQPDRPQGRHRHALPSAVKQVALEEGLTVLQPEKARDPAFAVSLAAVEPDVSVVVAYGQILPRAVIDVPNRGTLNVHASLLPRWRGAAPIQAAILAGDEETGISIMRLVERLDSGPVLLRERTPILDDETFGELELRLAELGALALVESLALVAMGGLSEEAQDESLATYAPRIDRAATAVDWRAPARQVARAIRAFDPRPGAFSRHRDADVKFFGARVAPDHHGDPGQVLEVDEMGLLVACAEGSVRIAWAQPAGRRRLAALDWYQGRGVRAGESFGA